MTPERWQQIKEVCDAVVARPADDRASFLRSACAGDDSLYHEVESLLAQAPGATSFLERPAAGAAGSAPDLMTGSLVGRRLGVYEVDAVLGAGGMGEVYRARDVKLGRDVAIKVLPGIFVRDRDRLARFEREARVLAGLNHPHIGAIYGVEESDRGEALVLELVEGPTL